VAPSIEACFILEPEGPLRFGGHPEDQTSVRAFPSSDTLFGALTWAVQVLDGKAAAEAWVEAFRSQEPPVLLSSALPYREGVAFVPRPQRRLAFDFESASTEEWDPKTLKRTEYIEVSLLSLWRSGWPDSPPVSLGEALVARERGWTANGSRYLWKTALRPGVALDRRTSASQVYSVLATSYACSLALYVLAETERDLDGLERLLTALGRTGVGGRRTGGLGAFRCKRVNSPLPLTARPIGLSLSLVWPRPDELAAGMLSPPEERGHRIIERRSWISSPPWSTSRTRTVAMLGEGSYLNPALSPIVGGLADVTPGVRDRRHPVYRYGLGLFLDEERLP